MRTKFMIVPLFALGLTACGNKEEAKTEAPVVPPPATAVPAPAPAVVDGAAKYAASCASCHGANGAGQGTFPKVAGLSADIVKTKLAAYKAGETVGSQSAMMMPIARQLSDEEVAALADHIATLK